MSDYSDIGERMKTYERPTDLYLIPNLPTIIRVDGKAFHSFTKKITEENDPTSKVGPSERLHTIMLTTALGLCNIAQNAVFAYTQSDEISILLVDYDNPRKEQWFGGRAQKIASVAAAGATAIFNREWTKHFPTGNSIDDLALFDGRVFQMPVHEVVNYFIWRQQDATRNSINFIARKYFTHKEMMYKNTNDLQDMLFKRYGINWNNYDTWKKRGACIVPNPNNNDSRVARIIDDEPPIFTENRNYIEMHSNPEGRIELLQGTFDNLKKFYWNTGADK